MTDAIKLLNSAFSGNGKQPKILLLRESHDDLSSVRFIHEHAEEIAARGGMAHFVELPYWFNSLLEGHRHGVISDRELSEYIESLHSAHFVTAAREKSDAIKTLNENGIKTIAIDSRYEDENNELNRWIGRDAYQRAKELSEQFPDSVRHKKFIKKKLREKIPTDSISAWIAYDFLGNEGSAVLTYGGSHMAGECQSHVQGILDDSLENQGAKVTDVQIESSYKTIKETKSYYKLSKENGNVLFIGMAL